jgi:hypothetical protein
MLIAKMQQVLDLLFLPDQKLRQALLVYMRTMFFDNRELLSSFQTCFYMDW